jgi:hypothetical protein
MRIRRPTIDELRRALLKCLLLCLLGNQALAQGDKDIDKTISIDKIISEVNQYQERARKLVQNLKVVQLVVQASGEEERKEQATVTYHPPSEVKREVQWSNIGHPSNGFPLKHLLGFPLLTTNYDVSLVGTETVGGHAAYKLQLKPKPGDERRIDGFLWVSTTDYGPVKVEGNMTNPPFPIKSLKMVWDYGPGPSGLWVIKRDFTDAVAKIVFKVIKGQSTATYDHYELNAQ